MVACDKNRMCSGDMSQNRGMSQHTEEKVGGK